VSRETHFALGLGLTVACFLWGLIGVVGLIGNGLGKDPNGRFFDAGFFEASLFWVAVLSALIWGVVRCFRRARLPQTDSGSQPSPGPAQTPPPAQSPTTPDERLAHLVKKA